ncbi:hypothetical protein D3C83_146410 [compost metagenome]
MFDVENRLKQTEAAHHEFHIVGFDDFCSDVAVAAAYSVKYRPYWNVVSSKFDRIDINLIFANKASNAADFCHSRN